MTEGEVEAHHTADQVARRSYGRLLAFLVSRTGDVAAAEDALSDAFAAALATWPRTGSPASPEGWLLTAARRKLIDASRRSRVNQIASEQIRLLTDGFESASISADTIPDHRLAMLFACAHPAIDVGVRAPLMLQIVLGLDAKMIASAFLTSPAAMGKRLVRAKERIRQAGVPLTVPECEELPARLAPVLDAIYAAFSEGWIDPAGTDAMRRDLTGESLYLARLVVELLPDQAEALGLLALLLHADARRSARRTAEGEFLPFAEQDPARWDWAMIEEAESLLRRACALVRFGRYQLEGALQSAHVHRRRTGESNWDEIVRLYDALLELGGSPVVAVNRALAVGHVDGPVRGLAALQTVADDARLVDYQPYWAARAELLGGAGAIAEARHAYDVAIGLERDPAVRRFLQRRQDALAG